MTQTTRLLIEICAQKRIHLKRRFQETLRDQLRNLIFNLREQKALEQINHYFARNPKVRDVILIYGSDHYLSFQKHPKIFTAHCFLVPAEFVTSIAQAPARDPCQSNHGHGID